MMRIVVADDEVEIRRLVINNLNQTGRYMVVGEAGTGEEALSEILRTKPDALVTDICMPHMDGLELTAELVRREIPIRVVIVSGYDDFTYAKKAITYGVDDYLLKPFLPSELYTVLDAIATSLAQRQYCNLDRDAARKKFLQVLATEAMDAAKIKEGLTSLDINLTGYYYVAGVCRNYGDTCLSDEQAEQLWSAVSSWFPQVEQTGLHCQGFLLPNRQFALVCSFEGTQVEAFRTALEGMISTLSAKMERQMCRKLWCGFSEFYTSLTKTPMAKEQAERVWKQYYRFTRFCRFFDEAHPETLEEDRIRETMKAAMEVVRQKTLTADETVFGSIEVVFQQLSSLARIDINAMELQLTGFLLKVSSLIHEEGTGTGSAQEMRLLDYLRHGDSFGSLYEAHEILCGAVRQYLDKRERDRRSAPQIIVALVKKNIGEHLADTDLDVRKAIEGLDFSESYIRHVFKQTEGMSIKDYLIKTRMEAAKRLLADSTTKVQYVSQQTGFKDQCYFSRVFSEYAHCSPTEYRETATRTKKPFSP